MKASGGNAVIVLIPDEQVIEGLYPKNARTSTIFVIVTCGMAYVYDCSQGNSDD